MNIFEEVKSRTSILRVCDLLGIKLNRNNKSLCPFHKESTPSFSVHPDKNIFYCFGCNKKGDAVTLVQETLNLTPYESIKYLNDALNLGFTLKGRRNVNDAAVNKFQQRRKARETFIKWENETFQMLCDYWKLLQQWKQEKNPEDDLYVEACKNEGYISYIIDDIFIYGTDEEKNYFRKNGRKVVMECERGLRGRTS